MGLFRKRPKMPESIEAAMASRASDFITSFQGPEAPIDATQLDYSFDSLSLVDQILDDFYTQSAPLPEDLHFLASAYVLETTRKQYGGRYLSGDEDNPFVLVIGEPDCQIGFCAMQKVKGRAVNGPEDDLQFFYQGIERPLAAKTSTTII